ncbi:DUF5776 domain-containing protein [Vagococcus xieshaowenii]
MVKIERKIRAGLPQVGVTPYGQIHAHSTGNPNSTAQNEADNQVNNKPEAFFSHVVGNGRIIQIAEVNRGFYDVGGGWNAWGYAAVELIESHKTQAEFDKDYKIYVDLLRQLAKEAGLPIKGDSGNTGIITHDYARQHQPNNGTDHVDPYKYLAKWGISKAQFKKDVENGITGGSTGGNTGSNDFNINNYHTTKFAQIELIKEDWAYKEVGLKNKKEKCKKGTILTVVGIEYSGKYPGFKLKSGLYITTRKDTVKEYKKASTSKPTTPATAKWVAENGTFILGQQLPLTADYSGNGKLIANIAKGQAIKYNAYLNDGKYIWIRQKRGNGYGYMATGNVKNGKRSDYWGTFK